MKRLWLILALVLLALMAAYPLLRSGRAGERKQSSVGEFELLGVTAAGQVFRDGSRFERACEKLIPFGGLNLGPLRLHKPAHRKEKRAPLAAWVLYRGTRMPAPLSTPLFGSSVIVLDSSGKEFANGFPSVVRSSSNQVLLEIPIASFPSDQDQFQLRFSPPRGSGTNREWVEFTIQNPLPKSPRMQPQTNQVDGQAIVLRTVAAAPASFEFQLPGPGWSVEHCALRDGDGNELRPGLISSRDSVGTGESFYRCTFNQPLATNLSWRIHLSLLDHSHTVREPKRVDTEFRLPSSGNTRANH